MKYNNGTYYEGDWSHDTMTGKGTLYTEDNEAAYIGSGRITYSMEEGHSTISMFM